MARVLNRLLDKMDKHEMNQNVKNEHITKQDRYVSDLESELRAKDDKVNDLLKEREVFSDREANIKEELADVKGELSRLKKDVTDHHGKYNKETEEDNLDFKLLTLEEHLKEIKELVWKQIEVHGESKIKLSHKRTEEINNE